MKVRPDQKLVLLRDLEDQTERMAQVTRLLTKLAELAKAPATEISIPPASPVLVKKPPGPQPAANRAKPAGVRR